MAFTTTQLQLIEQAIGLYQRDTTVTSATRMADLVTGNAAQRRAILLPYVQAIQAQYQATQAALPTLQATQTATVNQEVTDAVAVVTGL